MKDYLVELDGNSYVLRCEESETKSTGERPMLPEQEELTLDGNG